MSTPAELKSALALIVAGHGVPIPRVPPGGDCVVERAGSGAQALEVARETQPDVVLINDTLPDMSGLELCRAMRADPEIGHHLPLLLMVAGQATTDQRVAALREGVWDFISLPIEGSELAIRLQIYSQAKRNIEERTDGLDLDARLHSAGELSRQAQRLGALMARLHSSLACVVFEVDDGASELLTGSMIARTARSSDVVGVLSPGRIGVLAPATEHSGAVQLSLRVARELRRRLDARGQENGAAKTGIRLVAGFDAVSNVKYSPLDPLRLIQRAASAARTGTLEPGQMWLRRHRDEPAADPFARELQEARELLESRSADR